MANDPIVTKLGNVSAYLDAVAHGFTGTRAEFGELLANSAKLSSDVTQLKADLDANDISVRLSFSGDYAPYYQFGWQLGDSSSGSINPSRKYRITSQIVTYESPVTLVLDDGYQLYTVIYNDDGTVKNTISWRSAIMVSAGQKVSITIKKTSGDSSIVLDALEVLSHLHFLFANCGDYLLFYGNPNNVTAISNPVYARMGSDPISGAIGRLRVRANGYRHFLQTFEADGTKLTDTNFVSGDYEYALDVTRTYKIWFARIDNQNIEANDIEKNVAVFMQRSGVPDAVSLNESQLPYVQQLFGGRPSLIGTDHELAFVHFSDVHRSQTNWNRVMQFAKQFSGNLSFAIHTGDFVAGDQRGYTNLYENGFDSGIPELNVVGNHDVYTDFANRTMATKSVTKSLIFPDTSDWGVTWGTDDEPMSYYKDFATKKVRLVVLDCYYDKESQASWLATVLAEAKSLGYAVITATHEVTKSLTEFVDCTFTTKDIDALTTAGLNHSSTPYDAVIKAFKDSGGEHVCNLCGHEHVDIIGYSENGILNVVIGASLGYDSTSSDIYRAVNTRTFDLFNAVSINQNQHLIKIVRIGANTDHYLQGRNVLCYDYQSKKVIANY